MTGELCIKGYSIMKGYWNDDEVNFVFLKRKQKILQIRMDGCILEIWHQWIAKAISKQLEE